MIKKKNNNKKKKKQKFFNEKWCQSTKMQN